MILLMSIFVLLVGVLMFAFPDTWFELTEHWKSYAPSEPSKWYRISCRIGGGCMLLVGLAGVVVFFVCR
ncbi:MAG: hypothetical protein E7429_03850 [Ruminococcaceae bacterium]|nr:hypothetical protein [Oscillospiraceae bacterium]